MATFHKIAFLIVFLAAKAYAGPPAISLEKQTDEGNLQNAFTQEKGKWVYVSNTNFFDQSNLSIGEFEITDQKLLKKPLQALDNIYASLQKTEKRAGPPKKKLLLHQTHYKVGKYVVDRKHPYFKRVAQIYEALRFNSKTKQRVGLALEQKKSLHLVSYKNGKAVESKPFNVDFHCQSQGKIKVCDFEKTGVLFLK